MNGISCDFYKRCQRTVYHSITLLLHTTYLPYSYVGAGAVHSYSAKFPTRLSRCHMWLLTIASVLTAERGTQPQNTLSVAGTSHSPPQT